MNTTTAVTAGILGLALVAAIAVYSLGLRPGYTAQAVVLPPPLESALTTEPETSRSAYGLVPSVHTSSVNTISSTFATLRGTVHPNGLDTVYWFEYSIDPNIGPTLLRVTSGKFLKAGDRSMPVTIDVSGLKPKTTYYVRLVAQNSGGIVYGNRTTFKTK